MGVAPRPSGAGTPAAVGAALRKAARFDRSAVSLRAGLVAAIPVAGVLTAGTLAGQTVAAVTMGAGAMLVGIAWRASGGMPPLATMATDAAVMGLSTFAGAASGRLPSLHLVLLAAWAAAAGLIVSVGRRSAVVGTQAIIAFVVFGRFSQPIPGAAGLAGLVLAGGAVQVLFCAVFGIPPALRVQRSAAAAAYRRLAELARDPDARAAMAAAALDEADWKLSSPTLLGDAAMMTLSALVQEGRRMRLEFAALSLLLAQFAREHGGAGTALREATDRVRACAAEALRCIAAVVEGDVGAFGPMGVRLAANVPDVEADRLRPPLQALSAAVGALGPSGVRLAANVPGTFRPHGADSLGAQIADRLERHAVALEGQIRAAAGLAAGVDGDRSRR